MIYGLMACPQLLRALVVAGHGSKIPFADANCPHATGVSPRHKFVSLNFASDMFGAAQIFGVLKQVCPIEKVEIMVPAPDAPQVQIPIHKEFKAQLPDTEFAELFRFDFYDAARSKDASTIVATDEQRLYDNLLLIMGVRMLGQ